MKPTTLPVNPDHVLVQRFLSQSDGPIAVETSPIARALKVQLIQANAEAGTVELAFEPDGLFVQGASILQGGAVTAMLDFAMAFAAMTRLPTTSGVATVSLNTSYLRTAPLARYIAVGEVERQGRSMVFTQARLLRERDRQPVASASSALAVVPAEPTPPQPR